MRTNKVKILDVVKTGKNLKEIREKSGLAVKDISRLTGLHVNAIYKWEYGLSCPQIDTLILLERIYGVGMSELVVKTGCAARNVDLSGRHVQPNHILATGLDATRTGMKLKKLRNDHGFTLRYISDSLQVNRQTVYRWECGDFMPTVNHILMLEDIYGIKAEDMIVRI